MAPIDDIARLITDAIINALKDREDELKSIAEAGGSKASNGFLGDVGTLFDIINGLVGNALSIAGMFFPPLELLKSVDDAGGKLGRGFGLGYVLGYSAWQSIQPALLPIQHAVADAAQTEIFDPSTAAMLQSKQIIDDAYGRSEAAGGNLSGEHYDKLVAAAQQYPDTVSLLDLLNLQIISQDDYVNAMRLHGYKDEWIQRMLALKRQLLSPADLALAFLRTDIDETTLRGYQHQLGMTDADMDVLIGNTGEPPGPEQLMEALRRGFIDVTRFSRGIRQSRVRNEWLDVEQKLAFSPMSTADAIRAVVENYLTSDEGKAIAVQNGLEADHWDVMVESWGRPLSHEQMMTLYHLGEATIDQVHQAFRESDLKDKYIDQAVALGRRLVPERTIVSMLQHAVITQDTAMTMLAQQGYNQQDSESLIALGAAQHKVAVKGLTRSDVLTLYGDSAMNSADAIAHLKAIGYSDTDAQELIALENAKTAAANRKTQTTALRASWKAGHLTDAQALTQLMQLGMDHNQAALLIDEWAAAKGVPVHQLSESQIVKLAQAQLITPQDALQRLTNYGLPADDAQLWLIYEGVLPNPNPPTPAPTAGQPVIPGIPPAGTVAPTNPPATTPGPSPPTAGIGP